MNRGRKQCVVTKGCVACGCCVKACPLGAIEVNRGLEAVIDSGRCVGCKKCAWVCPAMAIEIVEKGKN